ncbi:MAG: alpha/beta hydrolase [Candidatus Omnitrophota bacterium]
MPYITAKSGIRWHYKTKGLGEILFFIHGWSSDCDVWHNQLDYFYNHYKVVIIDLPGHGKTPWKDISFNIMVNDLVQILNQFEQKINIVGTSFGGAIAIKLAGKLGNSVKRLILVDTSAKFMSALDFIGALEKKELNELKSLIKLYYPNGLLIFYRNLFTSFEKRQVNFPSIWQKFKHRKKFPEKKSLLKFLNIIDNLDLRDELLKIKARTLIVAGSLDSLFRKTCHNYLADNIKNSKIVFLENLGHVPFLTDPSAFNHVLDEFLMPKQAININDTTIEVSKKLV